MKLLDIINEIKEKDFTDDERLWLQAINFNFYDSQGKKLKRLCYDFDDNPEFESEYGNMNVDKYKYRVDESYINFVVIECNVLLMEFAEGKGMNKRIECNKCAFFQKDGYQDMGAHYDVCKANPDIWDALIGSDEPKEHCKYAVNIKDALKEAREAWRREKEKKE